MSIPEFKVTEENELSLTVPLGNSSETDLMAALEFVICNYRCQSSFATIYEDVTERERAVDWLHAKYGSR